jgi:hypothetical protein
LTLSNVQLSQIDSAELLSTLGYILSLMPSHRAFITGDDFSQKILNFLRSDDGLYFCRTFTLKEISSLMGEFDN